MKRLLKSVFHNSSNRLSCSKKKKIADIFFCEIFCVHQFGFLILFSLKIRIGEKKCEKLIIQEFDVSEKLFVSLTLFGDRIVEPFERIQNFLMISYFSLTILNQQLHCLLISVFRVFEFLIFNSSKNKRMSFS